MSIGRKAKQVINDGLVNRLSRVYKDERGITGLETAIVLIAFVVVASVFAFTVLTTGLYGTSKAKDSVEAGLSVAGSTLAKKGATVLTADTTVETIHFKLASAAGSEPIDLDPNRTLVTYADENNRVNAKYVTEFPENPVDEVYWKYAWPLDGTSGPVVDPGEVAEFTLNVANLNNSLGANTKIKIEVIPTEGAVVPVFTTIPLELKPVMVLP